MLRASKNPHTEALDQRSVKIGHGITGWVALHKKPVAIESENWKYAKMLRTRK